MVFHTISFFGVCLQWDRSCLIGIYDILVINTWSQLSPVIAMTRLTLYGRTRTDRGNCGTKLHATLDIPGQKLGCQIHQCERMILHEDDKNYFTTRLTCAFQDEKTSEYI